MKDLPPVSWGKQNLNQTEDIYVCMKYVYACPDFFFLLACVTLFIFA